MCLHQVTAQADILGETSVADFADEIPATATLVLSVFVQAVLDLVTPAALRTLQGEIFVRKTSRVPRLTRGRVLPEET